MGATDMRKRLYLFVTALLALLAFSSPGAALDFSGQSRSYLQSRESSDASKLMPFFEYLDFKAEDIGSQSVSFHFGGWLRYDLREPSGSDQNRNNSDLQYAYLRIKANQANAAVDLGRVLVNEGVASEQIDGAYVRTSLLAGFGIAVYGGIPAETMFDDRSGDSIYGGRISHAVQDVYRIGFSYLKEQNGNELFNGKDVSKNFREEEGGDLWLRPLNRVELLGSSSYNAITAAWMKHAYYLTLGPFSNLSFRTEFTEISYKDFFTSATTTAFIFDPTIIDPNEKVSTVGEEVAWNLGSTTLSADYKNYNYRIAGDANYYGGRLTFATVPQNIAAGLSFHKMDGKTDALRYKEYRLYGSKKFSTADITVDLFAVEYNAEINGVKNAYSASLAGGYALSPKARLAADIAYSKDPFFNKDVKGLVKFVYNFDMVSSAQGRK
jgi:hypothetical protein